MNETKRTKVKKRVVKVEKVGQAHIKAEYSNIIVSMTNNQGQVIAASSAGKRGFRGSKKSTPYAAQQTAEESAKAAYGYGLREVTVFMKGTGIGRESAVRAIENAGIEVKEIRDVTPLPHNGCRPPKRRRP